MRPFTATEEDTVRQPQTRRSTASSPPMTATFCERHRSASASANRLTCIGSGPQVLVPWDDGVGWPWSGAWSTVLPVPRLLPVRASGGGEAKGAQRLYAPMPARQRPLTDQIKQPPGRIRAAGPAQGAGTAAPRCSRSSGPSPGGLVVEGEQADLDAGARGSGVRAGAVDE